ncbi:haloacid dehalogenase [Haloprofundus marisrubri]|uniref:Haloacid dehalogenase n=1 Tax=Haloprofundus marisrubri TaxID=1514971 RepID=A0A0W1R5U0_9EURY|nr:HAD family hydrolase [Haloprofundus marisrubri]KTG08795.1 haloacid dehalogenase [Haloprofundus marisrubri]
MTTIDAVLFDLDGTLCRQDQTGDSIYYGAFERAGVDAFGEPSDLWAALDGPPDPDDQLGYLASGFTVVAARYGRPSVDADALARGFLDVVDYSKVSLHRGATTALRRAREAGSVGLVTNGPESRQSVKLDSLDLFDAFDVVVYAGDLPRRKPHRDPFDAAIDRLGVAPESTLHVGNSLQYDVAGAQGAGLQAAWYAGEGGGGDGDAENETAQPDPGDYRPEYVFVSLTDLCTLLDGDR